MRLTVEVPVAASRAEVWAAVSTVDGINQEVAPILRMTDPTHGAHFDAEPWRTSTPVLWQLVVGFIPVDRHRVELVALPDGRGFRESSSSWWHRVWWHERTLLDGPGGCIVRDDVEIQPRLGVSDRMIGWSVRWMFRRRHRHLRRRFGERPRAGELPERTGHLVTTLPPYGALTDVCPGGTPMLPRTGYPSGVPCWVDLVTPDPDATMAFYRDLFGWTYEVRTPEGAPQRYAYARLDGLLVAGVGGPPGHDEPQGWTSYVWVDSADETLGRVRANGGEIRSGPVDIPRAGRVATCVDPSGASFGVWQPAENRGAELVNAPGSWNFSGLEVEEPAAAEAFYGAVFGWRATPLDMGDGPGTWIFRVDGYGDFLAERDPELRERQSDDQAPEGFADAVATMTRTEGPARWDVTFAVADADAAFARATELGAGVVTPLFDTDYTRQGVIADPQGAVLTLSEYRPPSG